MVTDHAKLVVLLLPFSRQPGIIKINSDPLPAQPILTRMYGHRYIEYDKLSWSLHKFNKIYSKSVPILMCVDFVKFSNG